MRRGLPGRAGHRPGFEIDGEVVLAEISLRRRRRLGWGGQLDPFFGQVASVLGAAVVGVADHLGHRHRVIFEQILQNLAVAGSGGGGLAGHEQVRVDIHADVQLVTVVAVPAGTMPVTGVRIDRRDHPLGGHPLSNPHPARPVVFDILGGHCRQQLHLGHQSRIVIPPQAMITRQASANRSLTSAWRSASDAQQISGLPSRS